MWKEEDMGNKNWPFLLLVFTSFLAVLCFSSIVSVWPGGFRDTEPATAEVHKSFANVSSAL